MVYYLAFAKASDKKGTLSRFKEVTKNLVALKNVKTRDRTSHTHNLVMDQAITVMMEMRYWS